MSEFNILVPFGGIGDSYASISDLDNISLPRGGERATIDSANFPSSPLNLSGLTLKFQITKDGIVNVPITFTFLANYLTLDQAVAAFTVGDLVASNNSGRFRIQTLKYGYDQGILLDKTGTANPILFFDNLENTDERGVTTLTHQFTDDEKAYQLVIASAEADSYLARRGMTTPVKRWDYKLVEVVCDIAAYKLMFRNGYSPNSGSYDKNYQTRHDAAIQWLSDVGNRMLHPVWITGKPIPTVGSGYGDRFTDPRGWNIASGTGCGCRRGPLGYGN